MARHLQYLYAPRCVVQYGLVLGAQTRFGSGPSNYFHRLARLLNLAAAAQPRRRYCTRLFLAKLSRLRPISTAIHRRSNHHLQLLHRANQETTADIAESNHSICSPISRVFPHYGSDPALYVCSRDQGLVRNERTSRENGPISRMARRYAFRACNDQFLELSHRLAEGGCA